MKLEQLTVGILTAVFFAFVSAPAAAVEPKRGHQFALVAGGSEDGAYFQFAWTSPKRVGVYFRLFPLMDDEAEPNYNVTVTEESAGEIGIAIRANRWLTVGAGFAQHETVVSTYGGPIPLFGNPQLLSEETTSDAGAGAVAIFAIPSKSPKAAFTISTSVSTVGSGVAIGVIFGK